jgi:hypothetical protein
MRTTNRDASPPCGRRNLSANPRCILAFKEDDLMLFVLVRVINRKTLLTICQGLAVIFWLRMEVNAHERERTSFVSKIILHGLPLDLHLSDLGAHPLRPVLVLYASGDGGWYGEAVGMFEEISAFGYPTVGFSSRSYMKILSRSQEPVTLEELIKDYQLIIEEAKKSLNLPRDTKTVLSGWSRGAAFSVLVGADKSSEQGLLGVLAIGLPHKEELDIHRHERKIVILDHSSKHQHIIFDTYELFSSMASLPTALIQSSHDEYLPAEKAHTLFGEDTRLKRFYSVSARNHRFSGGRDEFRAKLYEALDWLCGMTKQN